MLSENNATKYARLLYMDNMRKITRQQAPATARPGKRGSAKPVARTRQVPALSRGIAILRLLGRSDAPLGVHEIARSLDLVPSTCLHILRVLAAERLLTVDPVTKKYTIAAGLAVLARSALRQQTFPAAVQPDLDELSGTYGATAIAVEASGLQHMVVVALSRADSPLQVHVDIGSRFPALISATGRCIAAFGTHPWPEIKARFSKLRWDAPPTLADWRSEVRATQLAGYAIDEGRYIRGVSIIAAPVRMRNGSINALVVVGLSEQMRQIGLAKMGEELRRRATRLSEAFGEAASTASSRASPRRP
jgi:DNA-binding IclR family transcriptional regulator